MILPVGDHELDLRPAIESRELQVWRDSDGLVGHSGGARARRR